MGRNFALNTAQIAKAADMHAHGHSLGDIAVHFGISRQAIKNGLAVIGVKPRDREQARRIAVIRKSYEKPAPARRDWAWLNHESAPKWQVASTEMQRTPL